MNEKTPIADLVGDHEFTWLLLPWYRNGTLEGDDYRMVQNHLGSCLVCRQELARLSRHVALVEKYDAMSTPAEQSFEKLMRGIKASERNNTLHKTSAIQRFFERIARVWERPLFFQSQLIWVLPLLLITAIGGGVGILYYQSAAPVATYRTLSGDTVYAHLPENARPLRALFEENLSLKDFHALLNECGLIINAGPNSAGAYTLHHVQGAASEALECLRNKPPVRFAGYAVSGKSQ